MSRPVVLVDIGDAALPAITPVVPVLASWVPLVYVAPPPAAPTDVTAAPVADGVFLQWQHPGGRGIEFRIERTEDVEGEPDDEAWIQIAATSELRYTATTTATSVDGHWYRVRAVRNGKYSEYTAPIYQWPYASNPPTRVLDVQDGGVVIDCRWTKFQLLLDQSVAVTAFINVPPTKTVLMYVTQSGGGHLLTFPPYVSSINGVPYVTSPVAGSIDVLGLDTDDQGLNWSLIAQQPAAGGSAFAVTAFPSPAYETVYCNGVTAVAPSQAMTAEQVNGVAPVTCEWTRVDGGGAADFLVDDATSATPVFSIAAGTTNYNETQAWRVVFTDAVGRQVNALVTIRLERIVSVEDIAGSLLNPGFESGDTGWDRGPSTSVVAAHPYTGTRSLQLNTGFTGSSESINQFQATVAEGMVLTARCMIHQGASDAGKAGGHVRIKWYTAAGVFISNTDGNIVNNGSGGAQHPSTIAAAAAPAGAGKARLAIVLFRNAQNNVVNADDASWGRTS